MAKIWSLIVVGNFFRKTKIVRNGRRVITQEYENSAVKCDIYEVYKYYDTFRKHHVPNRYYQCRDFSQGFGPEIDFDQRQDLNPVVYSSFSV